MRRSHSWRHGLALGLAFLTGSLGAGAGWAVVARADDAVTRARSQIENADFHAALDSIDRAESSGDLDRDALVELLELEAVVHFALGQASEVRGDLNALLSLDPHYQMSVLRPPGLRSALEDARRAIDGPLELLVTAEPTSRGVRLRARLIRDVAAIVREVRISARLRGERRWRTARADSLDVAATTGAQIEHYAVALGPGGAIVASAASATSPAATRVGPGAVGGGLDVRASGGGLGSSSGGGGSGSDDADGGGSATWWLVGAGVLAVAAAITIVAVVATSGESDRTQIGMPVFDTP